MAGQCSISKVVTKVLANRALNFVGFNRDKSFEIMTLSFKKFNIDLSVIKYFTSQFERVLFMTESCCVSIENFEQKRC